MIAPPPAPGAGTEADELGRWIDAAPTPFHAVAGAAALLDAAGFTALDPATDWDAAAAGPAYVARDGALVAWAGPAPTGAGGPLRLIGAHTDSPALRVRPRPDTGGSGWRQVGVEVYGGALLNSWLDRDLGLAGRVAVRVGDRSELRPFRTDGPVLRVPQLAIHLDRGANEGLALDRQRHLTPVWGLGAPREGDVREFLAGQVGVRAVDVLGWDATCFDVQPSARLGDDRALLAAPRLDNLCSSWGAVRALVAATAAPVRPDATPVVVLYDHEEVGSTTTTGAAGAWLAQVLERRARALGGGRDDLLVALARSLLLSADMAHATHPNYPERHEPRHGVRAGGGPVVKHNVNARYATDARGAAAFRLACDAAGVPVQDYSHRGDLPCGSTIGPLAAAGLAVDTVDVGMAQLSMHSARELMAAADVGLMLAAFTAWFTAG